MSEKTTDSFEQKVEHIPTPEEVLGILEQMTGGEYREINRYFDEQNNLYRLDAIAPGKAEDEQIELFYIRAGRYATGDGATETSIHSTYVSKDSFTAGPQATFVDGKWNIID